MSERHISKEYMKEIRDKANQALSHVGQSHTWIHWSDSNIDNENMHVGYDSISEMRRALDKAWDRRPQGCGGHYSNRGHCSGFNGHKNTDNGHNSNRNGHKNTVKASNCPGFCYGHKVAVTSCGDLG